MASSKPEKRLGEFLKEQQEPFILEVHLLERGYSKKRSSSKSNKGHYSSGNKKSLERSASCGFNKKREALFLFSNKFLTALHKKLDFQNRKCTPNEHVVNGTITCTSTADLPREAGNSLDYTVVETDRFSTASSSTVFNSCSVSDVDEDGTSLSSQKDKPLSSPDTCSMRLQSQQATSNGKHRHGCVEGCPLPQSQNNDETLNQHDSGMEQKTRSCGVLVPKKITEDSLLSAPLWSLLIQSAKKESYGYTMELRDLMGPNVSQILKSKGVWHKTKQLLFDCVREIAITVPRRDDGERGYKRQQLMMGAEELGRIICERAKEWGQQCAGDETNLTYLLTLDYLNSMSEWSKFPQHVKAISVEIADAILERLSYEIVSDMI